MGYSAIDLDNNHTSLLKSINFEIDNIAVVNEHFVRWREKEDACSKEWTITWVYCWTRRYFLRKFISGDIGSAGDAEKLMDEVFFKFYEKHSTVRETTLFAQWISVICRYRFLNYLRQSGKARYNSAVHDEFCIEENPEEEYIKALDANSFFETLVSDEMSVLPEHVRHVVRKKIWENKSYKEIAHETQTTVENVRAYFSRGLKALHQSQKLQDFTRRSR